MSNVWVIWNGDECCDREPYGIYSTRAAADLEIKRWNKACSASGTDQDRDALWIEKRPFNKPVTVGKHYYLYEHLKAV